RGTYVLVSTPAISRARVKWSPAGSSPDKEGFVQLEDKVAIVTGGAQGIGKAIARRFLQEGARGVAADINDEMGAATVRELGSLGKDLGALGSVRYLNCDVGSAEAVNKLIAAVTEAF